MRGRIILNGILLNGRRGGGVERCIRELAGALSRYGSMRYTFWCGAAEPDHGWEHERFRVRKTRIPFRSRALRIAWEQIVFPLRLRRAPAARLHAPGYVAPLLATRPFALTVYDLVALRFPGWAAGVNVGHYRWTLPASIRRAEIVITPSATVRAEILREFRLPETAVRAIAPAPASLFFDQPAASETDAARRHYRLPPEFILYAGRIEPKKNTEGLLQAYAALCRKHPPAPPLVLAGEAVWKSASFFALRRKLGLESKTICLGAVPDTGLRAVYRLATLLVAPSWYEGFGLPPLEAMACGTPVIVSTGGALPETAGPAALQFDPGNRDALVEAIRKVLTDAGLRARLSAGGRRHVRGNTPRLVAERHDAVYAGLLPSGAMLAP